MSELAFGVSAGLTYFALTALTDLPILNRGVAAVCIPLAIWALVWAIREEGR